MTHSRRGCSFLSALLMAAMAGNASAGAAPAGVPYLNAAWVEALPNGDALYHCRINVAEVADRTLSLAVQFRLADAARTIVQAKGSGGGLLLWPEKWRPVANPMVPLPPGASAVWKPAPVRLNAAFFAERAALGPGTHYVDAIFDVLDDAANQYVESGYYARATFLYTLGQDGRATLKVLEPGEKFPSRDLDKDPPPPIVWHDAQPLAQGAIPPSLRGYGLEPVRVLGSLRFRQGRGDWAGFARGGRVILSGRDGGELKVWDAATGDELRAAQGVPVLVADGSVLLLAPRDAQGARALLDPAADRKLAALADAPEILLAARLSADGSQLFLLSPEAFSVWDAASGARLRQAGLEKPPEGEGRGKPYPGLGTITPDGRLAGVAWDDGKRYGVDVHDTATGKRVLATAACYGTPALLELSPDGKTLATTVYEWNGPNGLALFDTATWKKKLDVPDTEDVKAMALSPDGSTLAVGYSHGLSLFNPATGALLKKLYTEAMVEAVAFTADGQVLCAKTYYGPRTWDAATGRPLAQPKMNGTTRLAPDGRRAVTMGREGEIVVWDPRSGAEVMASPGFEAMAISGDGSRIAARDAAGRVRVWDAATGRGILALSAPGGPLVLNANGTRLAAGDSAKAPMVWDVDRGEVLLAARARAGQCYAASLSPDGRLAATAWSNKSIHVHDLATQAEVLGQQFTDAASSMEFSPDSRRLAATVEYSLQASDVAARQPFRRLARIEWARHLAWSPDGAGLVCGEKPPEVFEAATGKSLRRLDAEDKLYVPRFAFSRDGGRIVAASEGGVLFIFDAATGRLLREMRGSLRLTGAAFSADGKLLLTPCEGSAVVAWRWE